MFESQVKMPFARSNQTGQIIGIAQAVRGDDCDCRCLSCHTPVSARKGEINQWHFSHRTNDLSIARECEFSPVTAIALIIRQELHQLSQFDLDEWVFTDIIWELNTTKHGVSIDAYAQDPITKMTIAVDIPFATSTALDVSRLPLDIDIVLRVDTHTMAQSLYMDKLTPELFSAEQIFKSLLVHWSDWVLMERCPNDNIDSMHSGNTEQGSTIYTAPDPQKNLQTSVCACCGSGPGYYGKRLLCKPCVSRYVGPKFNSLTEMINHYKSTI
ncbi:phosphatidylinositol kinase [Vibrio mediterranei]